MNIRFALPPQVEARIPEEIAFALPLDLDDRGKSTPGSLVVTRRALYVFKQDELLREQEIDGLEEVCVECHHGCGDMIAKKDGKQRYLCAFTQKHLLRHTEVADLLTHYLRTGEWIQTSARHEIACPKCDMPMTEEMTFCLHCTPKSRLLLRLMPMLKPYLWVFVFSVVFALLVEAAWLAYPYVQRRIVDDYILAGRAEFSGFIGWLGLAAGLFLAQMVFDVCSGRLSAKLSTSVSRDLRQTVFARIQAMSLSAVTRQSAGELIARVTKDMDKAQNFLAEEGREAVLRVFSMVVLITLLLYMNWQMAVMILLPVPLVVFFIRWVYRNIGRRYRHVWHEYAKEESKLHDVLTGIRVVKLFGAERREAKEYAMYSRRQAAAFCRAEVFWYCFYPLIGFLIVGGEYLVLYAGGHNVLAGDMQIGQLMQYVAYMYALYVPLQWAVNIPRRLAEISVSIGKIFDVIDSGNAIADIKDAHALDIRGDVTFRRVSFGYLPYRKVLNDISFEAKAGEMIGIVGLSGTGKSTMIHLIMRLYDVTDGALTIDGVDIRHIAQQSLRRQIGVVLQETYLFEGSVLDNIRFAKPDATLDEVIAAAKLANAHEFIVKLPDAYNTRVGNKGHALSGGERQRIAIARALLPNPRLLILDEATASLDTKTEQLIQDALAHLTKNRTTFAIAHRLSTLKNADRLIVLDKGKLAEIGTHEQLLEQKGVYYKLVMAQRRTSRLNKQDGA